jgi:hypothetical protein
LQAGDLRLVQVRDLPTAGRDDSRLRRHPFESAIPKPDDDGHGTEA